MGQQRWDLSNLPFNIKYKGIITHDAVFDIVNMSDVCLMPSKINALIEAVDPVKVYEYIALGKFVICPEYDEFVKFGDLINTYKNEDEFISYMKLAISQKSYEKDNRPNIKFALENTWTKRVAKIANILTDEAALK